jgi:hypothetical protein
VRVALVDTLVLVLLSTVLVDSWEKANSFFFFRLLLKRYEN